MRWPLGTDTNSDALTGYRNVIAVVAGLTILQAAMAAVSVFVALGLSQAHYPNLVVGIVAACFAGGFLVGTQFSSLEIRRIGHIRAYALFAALGALAALSFAFGISPIGWALIQAAIGLSSASLFTAGESWIADAAPEAQRGSILSFYHMISKTGAIAGPFLISATHSEVAGILLIAALFTASLVPITATNRSQPVLSTADPFGPREILKHAPASAFAAFCAGAVNNSVAQLYPVFTSHVAQGDAQVFTANFNAALLAGAMLGLWPAGRLSDRMDRRQVILGLSVLGALSAIGLFLLANVSTPTILLGFAFVFGAGSLSYYAIAVAHAADRSSPEQTTSMMAGILLIWGIGSVIGPAAAGLFMSLGLGAPGLFLFASLALAVLGMAMFSRTVRAAAVSVEQKEPFGVAPATSLAIAELDPRGDGDQLDLFSHSEANS